MQGFPDGSVVKNLPANLGAARDVGSIPGLEKFPGGENGNSLQYSCWGNPMDRGGWQATAHGAAKSQTWLSDQAQHSNIMVYSPRKEKPSEDNGKSVEKLSLSAPNKWGF